MPAHLAEVALSYSAPAGVDSLPELKGLSPVCHQLGSFLLLTETCCPVVLGFSSQDSAPLTMISRDDVIGVKNSDCAKLGKLV